MPVRLNNLTFDATNPDRLADFWARALGYEKKHGDAEWAQINQTGESDFMILFLAVPEGKAAKNRLHMDLKAADMDAEVRRLTALGARVGELHHMEGEGRWTIMQDPEGNEFCVFQP